MKEKISLLSRGIFEYEKPDIVISEDIVHIEAEMGTVYQGYFDVTSVNGMEIRAMIFSSHKQITFQENTFIGTACRVNFNFDPGVLTVDSPKLCGHFSIVSNGGEINVPFEAVIRAPFCMTSIGEINDLFGFTDLAKSNWHEAVKLFRSENFANIFLNSKRYVPLYEALRKSRNMNQAMEEFLCSIKRKKTIEVSVSQENIYMENVCEETSERLLIEKNTWGYQKINVRTEGNFISVYKKVLTTEDFLGSYYELEYMIHPDKFHSGKNYGKIILSTFNKEIEIPVHCARVNYNFQNETRRSLKQSLQHIWRNYMDLSLNRISKEEWIRKTREEVDCCRNNSDELFYQLIEAHFLLMAGEVTSAQGILDSINSWELRHQSVSYYGYHLYLNSLLRDDATYTRFALDKITTDYTRQYSYWPLLWMILQMNPKLSPQKRFALVKAQCEKGCRSPLLYMEALKALEEEPLLLREFGTFEVRLISWAVRHQCITEELIYKFAEVCTRSRGYNTLALKSLMDLNKVSDRKEILMGICSLLIKGHKVASEYNVWYRKGIEAGLKLTDIYEYYMFSLDESDVETLPLGVLIYFNYDNQLSVSKKAFLYAYVIKHQESIPKVYRSYENIMKAFTYEQLKSGFVNRDMVVLYNHFINAENLNRQTASILPKVLFKHEISCHHPGIRGVIVSHREVEKDASYPLNDGVAYVDIYMDEYQVIFVDSDDNRYIGSVDYTMTPLMDDAMLQKACYQLNPDQWMILANRSERAMKYHKMDDASIDIYKRTLRLLGIGKNYQKNILKYLIEFYCDNYEGETLERYLIGLDIRLMSDESRSQIIEYYIQRGLYEKAKEAISVYGFERIQDKKLMRLCSRLIRSKNFEKNDMITQMSWTAFQSGKYDDVILEYLNRHFIGTIPDLNSIWKAALDFEVSAFSIEEKILCQILFTESSAENTMTVFTSYYKKHPDSLIIQAFLAFYCYQYLVKDVAIDPLVFNYVEIELQQLEQAYDVCALALLKYYAATPLILSGNEEWVRTELGRFMERGIVLPFFKTFLGIAQIPEELLCKVYVQYCTNPKHNVTICYEYHPTGKDPGPFIQEDMVNVFGGIFVKAFTVFANEEIRYHITEKSSYCEIVTESKTITADVDVEENPENGADWINQMLVLKDKGDMKLLEEKMEKFETRRYMSKKLFTILQ